MDACNNGVSGSREAPHTAREPFTHAYRTDTVIPQVDLEAVSACGRRVGRELSRRAPCGRRAGSWSGSPP